MLLTNLVEVKLLKTLFNKIWDEHVVVSKDEKDLLYIDLHLIHEVTSPQAFEGLRLKNRKLRRPDRTFATMDHNTPTIKEHRKKIEDPLSVEQLDSLEKNCRDFGIELYDMDSEYNGIVHMIGPEMGLSLPGKTIVCGDSHTATHGAMGAIAFGIGTSEVEEVFATQCLWQKRPKNMGIKITGVLPENVSAKDIILHLIKEHSTSFGTGYAIEFYGETIENMEVEDRLTLCNMAIEAGAKFGIIRPDEKTVEYIKDRKYTPKGEEFEKYLKYVETLKTDSEDLFDEIKILDVTNLKPHVSFGTNPSMTVSIDEKFPEANTEELKKAYDYMELKPGMTVEDIPIEVVFIGSCTNGRIQDMRIAAEVLKGKKVHEDIRCIVVPGSMLAKNQCEEEGLDKIFIDAGCEFRMPGCSYCLAMNEDRIAEKVHCASTSNRNFEGRQGHLSRTHLMSPYMAAKCAVAGRVEIE
ncbi:3-isopropylmalate dehydratase large subunit [Anaerosphaera multitolerans]|uniref:3-isopropylmalate dehydratase large subunit n=1 Tax=Anaerosphaera multitolerans TaxID=2487351 RepID=A0A437S6M0_9FIRM|nr:3-isopropylmalate dehydratase large subunit [Anaerosphaera multitolerans]RVU54634.1 3-isopropylmalate dehydratase large subunit [Anaerosphaera multitolerans]